MGALAALAGQGLRVHGETWHGGKCAWLAGRRRCTESGLNERCASTEGLSSLHFIHV